MTLLINETEVSQLLSMPECIEQLRNAFTQIGQNSAANTPRVRTKGSGVMLHSLVAVSDTWGMSAFKTYASTREGVSFVVGLFDNASSQLLAMISADRLGQIRTGAATGLATDLLASEQPARIGLIGCGTQAGAQLEAMCCVRPPSQVLVYSRRIEKAEEFAALWSPKLDCEITVADSTEQLTKQSNLIATITPSKTPVIQGEWIQPGTHLNLAGGNQLRRTECDQETIRNADLVACDEIAQCQNESGELAQAVEAGVTDWNQIVPLDQLLARPYQRSENAITVFKSVGLGIEDLAAAQWIYQKAQEQGIGTRWNAMG